MSMAITISRGCLMAGFEVMRLSTASLWIKEKCNLVIGHNPNRLVTGFSQQICCDICSAFDAVPLHDFVALPFKKENTSEHPKETRKARQARENLCGPSSTSSVPLRGLPQATTSIEWDP
jgi:hypothetical protein